MSVAILFIVFGIVLLVGGVGIGFGWGRVAGFMYLKSKAQESCGAFTNPMVVQCPCMCGGWLESDGRNRYDSLTFLICTKCKCCCVAHDSKKKENAS